MKLDLCTWVIMVGVLVAASSSHAACTSPAAPAGNVIFNSTHKVMQYCNGTNWINTGAVIPSAPQTGCTNPTGIAGKVVYNNTLGVIQFCNGSKWVDTACAAMRSPNGTGCTGGAAGTMRYTANELQFCDSTNWVAMGWPCPPTIIPPVPAGAIAYISSSTSMANIQSLYSAEDWADTKTKKLYIASGATVGSSNPASAALLTGTSRGGELIIYNSGTIAGAGGAANGGVGGPALNVQQSNVTIYNTGNIYGGGGGGGRAGNGGQGGNGSAVVREPASGESYSRSAPMYYWLDYYMNGAEEIIWNGTTVYSGSGLGSATSYTIGGYTYYRATFRQSAAGGDYAYYAMYRQTAGGGATTGGAGGTGGNGGLGQGYNQTNTAGAAGATGLAGGTNAGTGGTGATGGAGGTWGQAGATGATGATGTAGNSTGGLAGAAGSAGGAAGPAITGSARTLNNTGSILGTY